MADEPDALQSAYPAIEMWHKLHQNLVFWSFDMLALHSANVGIGREFGNESGARGGGSRKIW
jgi:hypothetical protein